MSVPLRSLRMAVAAMLLPIFASAQAPAKTASAGSSGWTKRTPDGQPDLQGVWTNPTITPFERPVELGNKAFLTEQEAEEMERRAKANQVDKPPPPGHIVDHNPRHQVGRHGGYATRSIR